MADETAISTTTSESTTETPANDAVVETSALGGAGLDAAATDAAPATEEAKTPEQVAADAEAATAADVAAKAARAPEAYEFTAPEGVTLDPKDIEAATPVFKEMGLDNDEANKLIPLAAAFGQRIADKIAGEQLQQVTAWRKEQFDLARNDAEIGGAKWDESLTFASKALDTFGAVKGSPFRNALDESGWGNHPEMIRMFSKIGRAVGEDSNFVRGDTGASVAKTDAELFYPGISKSA